MSLMNLLNIGKSAVFANQAAINVTGNNIANVNTPGYTRQEAILRIATPIVPVAGGYLGIGVSVSSIERRYDRFISGQLLGQEQNYGKSSTMNQVLGQVEQVFNGNGGAGLSSALNAFFDAWQSLSTNPGDTAQRTVLISDANNFVAAAKQMESSILGTLKEINKAVSDAAGQVNSIATDIARLNGRIVQIESGGGTAKANDLRDARDQLVTRLSGLVDIGTLEDKNGSLTVTLGMRNLVDRETGNPVTAIKNAAGDAGLSLDGVDVTSRITKGSVGGLLASRDAVASGPLADLRRLAAAITNEMNPLHSDGVGLDGTTGNNFFTPLSPPLTEADAISNLGVAVTDPRKIAAASDPAAVPGDNTNALRIAGLADAAVSSLGGATFSGYYSGLVTDVGKLARNASDLSQFDANMRSELQNRRDSASGVSLDEEATNLIAFQRAYEAGAKIIRITDELLQTVLKL
ncbi:MAG: flagellar hook-associated protein FlgK [Desulfobacteria bacterium]|nr:flagellar hook-associated protein FlgK [Deltaproteobacteria bacterium]